MNEYIKRFFALFVLTVLLAMSLACTASAMNGDKIMNDVRDAVSTAEDMAGDLATDIKDAIDPEGNADPEAEEDGIVDDDRHPGEGNKDTSSDKKDTADSKNETDNGKNETDNGKNENDSGMAGTSDNKNDEAEETTGVIDGMELDKKGINPWAIVIAVVVVIAVLVLIFVLIPKRRG